jgi:hypothetical protein
LPAKAGSYFYVRQKTNEVPFLYIISLQYLMCVPGGMSVTVFRKFIAGGRNPVLPPAKCMKQLHCYIRENGWPAKIAARRLHVRQLAIVFNRTVFLHGVTATEFLQNTLWLRHEVCHVKQYRRYTFPGFLMLYLWQSLRHGYYNNRFEKEARAAEADTAMLHNVVCHIRP